MNAINSRIYEILEKAMVGNGLDDEEIAALYTTDPRSKEAAAIRWAGHELSMRSANGMAEIHAQIGLNGTVCPCNCKFCSFAACNDARKGTFEMPQADVLEYAKRFEDIGANLILLLTTASYRFEKLLDTVAAVREVISPEMPLLINTKDLSLEEYRAAKQAGANGAYHVVRMGEGVDTALPVEARLESMRLIREANLSLCTCVEPVGPEHTVNELVERTRQCIEFNGVSAGVGRRVAVPNTLLESKGEIDELYGGLLTAAYRLATGLHPKLNCWAYSAMTASSGANLTWIDAGTNPADSKDRTEEGIGCNLDSARRTLLDGGWEIMQGFSQGWMLDDAAAQ